MRVKKKLGGLTRWELTEALGVGLTTVDRMIARGLSSTGRRGRAKLYILRAARKVAERVAPAELAAADVLIVDYRSAAEDLHDRRHQLETLWVSDTAWMPAWRRLVTAIARATQEWPRRLADRLGHMSPEEAQRLPWADGPRLPPPPPRQYLSAAAVSVLLTGDPSARPWRPAAEPGISALAGRGVGIAIADDGTWAEWRPGAVQPEAFQYPAPLIRPLLEQLVDVVRRGERPLVVALQPPRQRRLPAAPRDVTAARAQWRTARAAYRRTRVGIRRGHRRRTDISAAIGSAISVFRARWWGARGQLAAHIGGGLAVLTAMEQLRAETLKNLTSLGGLVPPEATTTTRRGRAARKGRKRCGSHPRRQQTI